MSLKILQLLVVIILGLFCFLILLNQLENAPSRFSSSKPTIKERATKQNEAIKELGVKHGDKITIITPGILARLCPNPSCGQDQHITRIPEGTVLTVSGITDVTHGILTSEWFEVTYKGKRGWISVFDTDKAPN